MKMINKVRCLLAAMIGVILIAGPAHANKIDTLSGLTPGRLIGGRVHVIGGPDIPLAPETVDASGHVSFVKPNVNYLSIDYVDVATGNVFETLTTSDGTPLNRHLQAGERIPVFSPSQPLGYFFDIYIELEFPDFWQPELQIGDLYSFTDGENPDLPGITGFEAYGGTRYNGELEIIGFNTVSTPDSGTTLSLLCLSLSSLGLMRLWRSRTRWQAHF